MTKVSRNTIYERFRKYLYPKQAHFWDWVDSFFHKDDKIPVDAVEGLADQVNGMFTRTEGQALERKVDGVQTDLGLTQSNVLTLMDRCEELGVQISTGDAATLRNAKEYTDDREQAISTATDIKDENTLRTAKEYADTIVAALIDNSPETLDTLVELATALGNDPNFATTVMNLIGGKVDKEAGKGLSANDFTNELREKLAGIATGANNYVHPNNSSTRHVTDTEKTTWNAKETPTGAQQKASAALAAAQAYTDQAIAESGSSGGGDPNAVLFVKQTLTTAQKTQARNNIGAGTSSFSGNYNDLTNKPEIPSGGMLTYLGVVNNETTAIPTMTANTFVRLTSTYSRPVIFDPSGFKSGDKIVILSPAGFEIAYFSSQQGITTTYYSQFQTVSAPSSGGSSGGGELEGNYRYVATWFEEPGAGNGGHLHVDRFWETSQTV